MSNTIKEEIVSCLKGSVFLDLMGGINLDVLRRDLIASGFKRLPTNKSLIKICNELFARQMAGGKIKYLSNGEQIEC